MGLNLRAVEEVNLGIIEPKQGTCKSSTNILKTIRGKKVCFTGKIPGFTRRRLERWVSSHGGEYQANLTLSTDILIRGKGAAFHSKVTNAKRYGTQIYEYTDVRISRRGKGRIGEIKQIDVG